jgi:hypothetical protein
MIIVTFNNKVYSAIGSSFNLFPQTGMCSNQFAFDMHWWFTLKKKITRDGGDWTTLDFCNWCKNLSEDNMLRNNQRYNFLLKHGWSRKNHELKVGSISLDLPKPRNHVHYKNRQNFTPKVSSLLGKLHASNQSQLEQKNWDDTRKDVIHKSNNDTRECLRTFNKNVYSSNWLT